MSTLAIVLPGDEIPISHVSQNPKKPIVLGPGLRSVNPQTITASVAGALTVDTRKNAAWVEGHGGRYIPRVNDLVLVTVERSTIDAYMCSITAHAPPATLPQLAFESATKKTRPKLDPGALVYARISLASKDVEPELSCISASTGKADGMGLLSGGMVFDISAPFARRLLMPESKVPKPVSEGGGAIVVLQLLAEKTSFETAVGRNGKVWVDGGNVRTTLAVGRALVETDKKALNIELQRKLVSRSLRELAG